MVLPVSAPRQASCVLCSCRCHHRHSSSTRRRRNLSRVHLLPCTNLTCCPMIHPPSGPAGYSTEELSAGRPTCIACNVVHCNTKPTVNSGSEHHPASKGPASSTAVCSSMTLAFHLGPLSPARSWGRQNWTGPYRIACWTVWQVLCPIGCWSPHGVSSRPVWPGLPTDLQARARCVRCLAEQIHLGVATITKGTVLSAAWRRASSASRATCRQHMRACPLLDLAYGRTPVRPAAEAPRASCSSAAVCGYRVRAVPTVPIRQRCSHSLECTGTLYPILVTPWWIPLTIVINSQERSRDTEPEGPRRGAPPAAQSFPLQHGPSRPCCNVLDTLLYCTCGKQIQMWRGLSRLASGSARRAWSTK